MLWNAHKAKKGNGPSGFRPGIESLGERIVLSATFGNTLLPDVVKEFQIAAQGNINGVISQQAIIKQDLALIQEEASGISTWYSDATFNQTMFSNPGADQAAANNLNSALISEFQLVSQFEGSALLLAVDISSTGGFSLTDPIGKQAVSLFVAGGASFASAGGNINNADNTILQYARGNFDNYQNQSADQLYNLSGQNDYPDTYGNGATNFGATNNAFAENDPNHPGG